MDTRQRRTALRLAALTTLVLAAVLVWRLFAAGNDDSNEVMQADAEHLDAARDRLDNRNRPTSPTLDLGGAAKAAVSGTIHDPDKQPIAGARVCALANGRDLQGFGDPRHQCVRSGADGHYRLEGLWPVKTGIHVSAPTFKPNRWELRKADGRRQTELPLRAGQTVEKVDIELEPGGVVIRGIVKDIAGGEIEGAQVIVLGGWLNPTRGTAVELSGADGQFEIWVAPGEVEVRAAISGYAPGWVPAVAPGEFVELFLTPESVLVGKVVLASNGDPVEGAVIAATGDGARGFGSRNGTARSDANGRFRINELEPGSYKPIAQGDDFYGQPAEQVHLGLGETSEEIVIRVHPAVHIEGHVMIAGSDEPCAGARVTLDNQAINREYASADDEGYVEFRGVLAGDYKVSIYCEGYVPLDEYPNLIVAEANIEGVVWACNEGLAIRGEVVDEAGEPVPNINIRASAVIDPEAARSQATNASNDSEDDGSFAIQGLLPGRYEISTASWRGRPGPLDPITVELDSGADVNDVRIVMPAVGSVRGRIIDESGAPVPGANLAASLIGGRRSFGNASSRSNDAGEFEITDLRPGKTRVTATDGGSWWGGTSMRKPGTSDDDLQGEIVEIVANEVVEIVLTVESRGGTITGVVTDESGAPVADAFIDVERKSEKAGASASAARRSLHWSWGSQPVLTDQDGRFELGDLPDGTFLIRANRKGGGEAIAEDVDLGSHVALVITSTGQLAGTVSLAGGGVPERFAINIEDKAGGVRLQDSFFRTNGVWRLSQVPAGNYEIVATAAEGNVTLEDELELGEGEVREGVELVLAPRITIRGRIVDLETREPVAGLEVNVSGSNYYRSGDKDAEHRNVSGADGSFELADVPVGAIYLMAHNRAGGSKAKYQALFRPMTLKPEPLVQDIGEVEVLATRLEPNEPPGDLGYDLNGWDPTVEPENYEPIVALVRPGGPAVGSGLVAGDVIEKIQGHDVLGTNVSRYYQLTQLPEGSKVKLEVRGDKTVEITLGPPIR